MLRSDGELSDDTSVDGTSTTFGRTLLPSSSKAGMVFSPPTVIFVWHPSVIVALTGNAGIEQLPSFVPQSSAYLQVVSWWALRSA